MASYYVSNATGNWSTAATWAKSSQAIAAAGTVLHASTNITPTTGGVNSQAFTAPNITGNKSVGCVVFCASKAGTGNWTATLQEDTTGAGAWANTTATATITNATLVALNTLYFQWGTPYAYVFSGASRYRIQLKVSVSTSGTAAADSGAANFAYIEFNDINGPPALGDRGFIIPPNQTGNVVVTYTTTSGNNIGDAAGAFATAPVQRAWTNALTINGITNSGEEAKLKADTAASAALTIRGEVILSTGGSWERGTVATPYPAAQTDTVTFDCNGTSGLAGFTNFTGAKCIWQGAPSPNTTDWERSYASGTGTTIDPLIISSGAAFTANDYIMITSQTTGLSEWKYIKVVNSSTSYTLSNTAGGIEAGLSNAHLTSDMVLNLNRNVITQSNNNAQGWYGFNRTTIAGDFNLDWIQTLYCGDSNGTSSTKYGLSVIANASTTQGNCDYSVALQPRYRAWAFQSVRQAITFTGLVATSAGQTNLASSVGCFIINAASKLTFSHCYVVASRRGGFELSGATSNLTFNNCWMTGNNLANTAPSTSSPAQSLNLSGANNTFNNCNIQGNLGAGVSFIGSTETVFKNCSIGNISTNVLDIFTTTDTYNTALFSNCLFGSPTLVSNYLLAGTGTIIKFHKYQQTTNKHLWYTTYGSAQSTGAALVDTNVRTPNSLAVRLTPEDGTTGFSWVFLIPAKANSIVNFFGWVQLNAAFTGDAAASARVELWLPDSTTADASYTIPKTTNNWQAVSLSVQNNNSVDGLASVYIYGVSATVGAYLYADDLYNAGDTVTNSDKVTGLDTWLNGLPSPIIQPSATSAADIWTFNTASLTTANTTGKKLMDDLTVGKFLGLK